MPRSLLEVWITHISLGKVAVLLMAVLGYYLVFLKGELVSRRAFWRPDSLHLGF